MSAAVAKFLPGDTAEPAARLDEFIRLARGLKVLIPLQDWDPPSWSVGGSFVTKGQNRKNRNLHYYRIGSRAKRDGTVDGIVLAPRYIDFAKAYCRYTHAASPVQFGKQAKRLDALKFIEAAFRSLGLAPHIPDCNPMVLNTAVMLAKDGIEGNQVGAATHYQFAACIEQVHQFCYEHRFYNAPFQWRHGVKQPKPRSQQLGEGGRAWREQRLPSPEAYSALAHVFRNAETFADRLMSAVCAICCAVPIRAHEVLQLREDCEVREPARVKRSRPSGVQDDEEGKAYGIRVWPGKGNPPQVKWVPTVMVTVVQEAVQRLRDLCRPAREIAAWYEAHPAQLWLPPYLDHLRETDWISMADLEAILGVGHVHRWLNGKPGVRQRSEGKGRCQVRFDDVERVLLGLMPQRFPWFNGDRTQPYSRTLIVVRWNEMHAANGICPCVISQCTVRSFENWLSGNRGAMPSVFARWGFTERDGSPIEITTHCFRHWLSTVAQFRGMGELDIAKWSGRKPAQNRAYNHVTPEEWLSQIRVAIEEKGGAGPLFDAASPECFNRPVSREDFLKVQIGSAHVTDYGICIHEYSLLPCQAHGDCLGCSENVFVKEDRKHHEKIENRLELAIRQLEESRRAEGEGARGADRWTQDHQRKIEKMRTIVAIHLDASIADGTIVNPGATRLDNEIAMAVRDRKVLDGGSVQAGIPFDQDAADALKTMWGD